MKKAVTLITLSLALCAGGCASINKVMASWMGSHVSALVASWGPPQQVYSDGQGGRVLVYLLDRTYTLPASSTTTTIASGGVVGTQFYGNTQSYTTYTPEYTDGYTAYRMFWAGPDGIIYRWQWKGL